MTDFYPFWDYYRQERDPMRQIQRQQAELDLTEKRRQLGAQSFLANPQAVSGDVDIMRANQQRNEMFRRAYPDLAKAGFSASGGGGGGGHYGGGDQGGFDGSKAVDADRVGKAFGDYMTSKNPSSETLGDIGLHGGEDMVRAAIQQRAQKDATMNQIEAQRGIASGNQAVQIANAMADRDVNMYKTRVMNEHNFLNWAQQAADRNREFQANRSDTEWKRQQEIQHALERQQTFQAGRSDAEWKRGLDVQYAGLQERQLAQQREIAKTQQPSEAQIASIAADLKNNYPKMSEAERQILAKKQLLAGDPKLGLPKTPVRTSTPFLQTITDHFNKMPIGQIGQIIPGGTSDKIADIIRLFAQYTNPIAWATME